MKYTILRSLVGKFEDKLIKYTKKFEKYADGKVVYTKSEPYFVEDEDSNLYRHFAVDIELDGNFYKVGNYEFVAALDYQEEVGMNLVRKVSDIEVPVEYITSTKCEHCGIDRFRKHTTLLRDVETGKFIQVGNSCVKDFIGVNINDYLGYLSIFESLEEYVDTCNHEQLFAKEDVGFEPEEVLLQTIALVKDKGYVSQATIDKWYERNGDYVACPLTKTSSLIYHMFNKSTGIGTSKLIQPKYEGVEKYKDEMNAIVDWVLELPDNDYNRNLKILLKLSAIDNEHIGLFVSMVGYYYREQSKKDNKEVNSEYVGNVGDKVVIKAIPQCVYTSYNDFGNVYLYKFIVDGNVFTWRTSRGLGDCEYELKGTIKNHTEYNGIKQTELTRCRVVE